MAESVVYSGAKFLIKSKEMKDEYKAMTKQEKKKFLIIELEITNVLLKGPFYMFPDEDMSLICDKETLKPVDSHIDNGVEPGKTGTCMVVFSVPEEIKKVKLNFKSKKGEIKAIDIKL